jgi:hypothetical protein
LAQSRLSAGQGSTPTSVGIHYGPSERTAAAFLWLKRTRGSRGSGEQMTSTTLVAISSLLQRTAAPSLSGGFGAEHAAFSPIGFVAVPICAGPSPPPRQTPPWWRSAENEAVLRQLVNVLTRRCRGTRWGEVCWIRLGGLERDGVAAGLHLKANSVSSWLAS